MDKVCKKINLTEYRNREFNFVPFIPYNESYTGEDGAIPVYDSESKSWTVTNYGGFCYNISGETIINYLDALKKYARVRAQLADGIYLKRYNDNPQSCNGEAVSEEGCIYVPCDRNLDVNFRPKLRDDFRQNGVGDYLPISGCSEVTDEYIVLIDDIPEGWDTYLNISGRTGYDYVKPYLTIPILLTSDFDQVGILSNYEYTVAEDEEGHSVMVETPSGESGIEPKYMEFESGTTLESKLSSLRIGEYFFDEESTVALDYVFRMFSGSTSDGLVPYMEGSVSGSQFLKLVLYTGTTTATTTDTYSGIFHWDGNVWTISSITRTTTNKRVDYPYPINPDCYKIVPTDFQVPNSEHNVDYDSLLPTTPGEPGLPKDILFENLQLESSTTLDVKWLEALKRCPIIQSIKPTDEWIFNVNDRDGYYNTVTLVDVSLRGIDVSSLSLNPGDYRWVLTRFENGPINPYRGSDGQMHYRDIIPADYPYKEGVKTNVVGNDEYFDIVNDISEENGNIVFTYTIGSGNSESSGITYIDIYPYTPNYSGDTITVDGVSDIRVFYNKLHKDLVSTEVYSESLNLRRKANLSLTNSFMANTEWSESGNGITVPVFKDDSYIGLDYAPTITVNLEVNRGNATAFERHFKLMECQNFHELENYGNNYFNL